MEQLSFPNNGRVNAAIKQYRPQELLMSFQATQNEMIALGWVITHQINLIEQQMRKTPEQLDMITLLRSFQRRIIRYTRSPVTKEVRP